jgi:hypothetical protein
MKQYVDYITENFGNLQEKTTTLRGVRKKQTVPFIMYADDKSDFDDMVKDIQRDFGKRVSYKILPSLELTPEQEKMNYVGSDESDYAAVFSLKR